MASQACLDFQVKKRRSSKKIINNENDFNLGRPSKKGKASTLNDESAAALIESPRKRLAGVSRKVLSENEVNLPRTPTKNVGGALPSPCETVCQNLFSSPKKISPSKNFSKCVQSPTKSPRKSINYMVSPKKKITSKNNMEAYQQLKQSLATGSASNFVGRETEKKILENFLETHLLGLNPGSLYVSGAPGTGKTASVTALLEKMQVKDLQTVYLNCMSHKSTKDIFIQIASQFGIKTNQTESNLLRSIEKAITGSKPVLLILDEIDQLDSKNQNVLYTIFEWPSLAGSKLVLVGIANMLDLTDRILPRLQGNAACRPELLNFPPYTKQQISEILNARIKAANLGDVEVIKASAISFLSGKIAAVAGDVRKALDVCRRSVELVEGEARKQARQSSTSSPVKTLKQVDIVKVNMLFNEVYGSKITNDAANHPNSIPLQQKVLICTFLLFLKYAKSKIVTIAKLHEVYARVCTKQKLPAIGQSEFLSLCFLLESRGILEVRKAKEPRNSKVFLRLSLEESEQTLGDKNLMAAILEDKESLGKLCSKKQ